MPNVKPLELAMMLRTLAMVTEIFEHPTVGISYEGVWSTQVWRVANSTYHKLKR